MTWRSFVDFWLMREMGTRDAIIRNYDLSRWDRNHDNHNLCYSAIARLGVQFTRGNWRMAVAEIEARLMAMGFATDFDTVKIRLNQWYVWDRIKKQEIRKWPYDRTKKSSTTYDPFSGVTVCHQAPSDEGL